MAAVLAQESFRRGEQCPSPAVVAPVPVLGVDKILCYDIAPHFKAGDVSVEFAAHLCACKAASIAQVAGNHASAFLQGLEYRVLDASFFWAREHASAVIAEVRPPLAAYEGGFSIEELTVGAPALLYDVALPFPQRPFPSAVGKRGIAAFLVHRLLRRPARQAHAQQGQEANLLDIFYQLAAIVYLIRFHALVSLIGQSYSFSGIIAI